jgi:hypothetical protein
MYFDSALFLFIWIATLVFSWVLLRACNLSLTTPSIPSVVYIYYIGFNYLGLPLLFFYKVEHLFNLGVQDKSLLWFLWGMSACCLLLMLGGFLYAKTILIDSTSTSNIQLTQEYRPRIPYFEIGLILCLILIIFLRYKGKAEIIPLVELIKGNYESLNLLRSEAQHFSGKAWRYKLFFYDALPFVTYYLFSLVLVFRSFKSMPFILVAFISACLLSIMNLHKGPILHFFIGLIIVHLIYKRKPVSLLKILMFSIMGFSIIISTYVFFMDKEIGPKLLLTPVKRIFAGQIGSAYFYLEIFPDYQDFLYGKSFPNPGGILPFESTSLAKQVQDYIKPDLRGTGVQGSSPAVYWAEIYANFGAWAALMGSFLVGIFLFTIHWLLNKAVMTPLKIALIAWLAVHYGQLSVTSISTYLLDTSLFAVLLCYLMFRFGPDIRDNIIRKMLQFSKLQTSSNLREYLEP